MDSGEKKEQEGAITKRVVLKEGRKDDYYKGEETKKTVCSLVCVCVFKKWEDGDGTDFFELVCVLSVAPVLV